MPNTVRSPALLGHECDITNSTPLPWGFWVKIKNLINKDKQTKPQVIKLITANRIAKEEAEKAKPTADTSDAKRHLRLLLVKSTGTGKRQRPEVVNWFV
jgi:hypothetical protein